MGTTAAFTAVAVAGAAFLNSPSGRRALTKAVTTVKIYANSGKGRQTTQYVSDFFKNLFVHRLEMLLAFVLGVNQGVRISS